MVKVSIIVPAHNEGKYLEESIRSIISQDFIDFEIIIVNDFSSDNTQKIAEKICKENPKITLINLEKNSLRAAAVNVGLKKAKGDYITFLDGDDLTTKEGISKQVKFLDKNKEIDMVYSDREIFYEDGSRKFVDAIKFKRNPKEILLDASKNKESRKKTPGEILDENNEKKYIGGGSVMIRKNIFKKIKLDESLKNSADYDLWFQIIGANYKLAKLPIIGFYYRRHSSQKSSNKTNMTKAAKQISTKLIKGIYFK